MFLKKLVQHNYLYFLTNYWTALVPKYILRSNLNHPQIEFKTSPKHLISLLKLLQNHSLTKFKTLCDISVTDYLLNNNKRFLVSYNLVSTQFNLRYNVTLQINSFNLLPTCTTLFKGANWLEREVWDMFGIFFTNHPSLRRILTDYGFNAFPLRKDFPLVGFVEVYYDLKQKKIVLKKNKFFQGFRNFFKN